MTSSLQGFPPEDQWFRWACKQRSGKVQYSRSSFVENEASLTVACGYRRCVDLDSEDAAGQDYAAVSGLHHCVVGVVADGVGQSFFGEIAARNVGERVFSDLLSHHRSPPGREPLEQSLHELACQVNQEIESLALSDSIPLILRNALERTRKRGSQTVFGAFIFNAERGSADVYQVGDTFAWIHQTGSETRMVRADLKGRWSSTGRSLMLLEHQHFSDVSGIVIHTDGIREEWGRGLAMPEATEQEFCQETEVRAGYDDVSFISARSNSAEKQLESRNAATSNDRTVCNSPSEASE